MIEVELKFQVLDLDALKQRLQLQGAAPIHHELHRDTYFRHPCRDFVQTREALRIRRVIVTQATGDHPSLGTPEARVTYKGPKFSGEVKARHELEWLLSPSDPQGDAMQDLLTRLGFTPVTTVSKQRHSFALVRENREVLIAVDDVDEVGCYVEIETLATSETELESARGVVSRIADSLGLLSPESRSYLSLLLHRREQQTNPQL